MIADIEEQPVEEVGKLRAEIQRYARFTPLLLIESPNRMPSAESSLAQ